MKPLSIACSLLLAASVLCADEPKKTEADTAKPVVKAPATVLTTPAAPTESPLVSAAKRSKRTKKSTTPVITNDTLLKSGGHITSAEKQYELPAKVEPPPPAPKTDAEIMEEARLKGKKVQDAAKKAKDDASKKTNAQQANAALEDDSLDERYADPAAAEHAMSQTTTNPPQSQKPPQ